MATLQGLRAFLAVAGEGSFSAAARRLGVATSVVAKRIDQLEASTSTRLFRRTTRSMQLSEAGETWIRRVQAVVADLDEVLAGIGRTGHELGGPLRIKAPTTLTILHLAEVFARFQRQHPNVSLDITLADRALNPVDEGFDLAIGAFAATFPQVVDLPLCPLRRVLCASPAYLARGGAPSHPRDLTGHDTLCFQPTGPVWSFEGPTGPVQVEVNPKVSANDGQVLLASARAGNGIALLSEYIALPFLRAGELVALLPDHMPPEIWLKALVPENRIRVRRVRALLDVLETAFVPCPPWEQA